MPINEFGVCEFRRTPGWEVHFDEEILKKIKREEEITKVWELIKKKNLKA